MALTATAHVDTYCRDNLPPESQWPEFLFELPDLQYPERLNCATALLDDTVAALGPNRPCLRSQTSTWTYGDLLRHSNQIARVITEDFGVVPGNRVLLRGSNNMWMVACWFAVVKAGAVVVTTMPLLRAPELRKLIAITTPTVAIADSALAEELLEAAGTIPVITCGTNESTDLHTRASSKPDTFENVDTAADDVVLLAPTSGTTGVPKATMHFHRDVLANADTFSNYIVKPTADDIFTGTPPLAFTFGLGGLVIFPMRVGASTLLIERATPSELADALLEHHISVLFTAPTAYRAMLRAGKDQALRSVRRLVSAGEHLPESVWRDVKERTGKSILDGIGGTEMLHVFISASDDDIRPGSTGRAVPGFRAEIHDIDGIPVPDGTAGLLAVKGPTGCRYLSDPRQTSYVRDGWNMTGDSYIRDSDGYFWYQARSDDMIVSSGYNIAAPEVEWVIDQHPDVLESGVIGLPDDERGMVVHAIVVLAPGVPRDEAKVKELQNFVKQTAAPYKYPRSITFADELPKTPTGKLQRFRLHDCSTGAGS